MKKILIDLSFVRTKPYSGVAKYAYRIVDYIVASRSEEKFALLVDFYSEELIKKKYPQFETRTIGNRIIFHVPVFRTIWLSLSFRYLLNHADYNIVFCPWANMITCLKNKKYVVSVIHDLQSLIDHKGTLLYFFKWVLNHVIKNSNKLVTVSDFSKDQFLSFFPNNVIENWGNSVSLLQDNLNNNPLPYHYILYVGRLSRMKNVITLVKAYARIWSNCDGRKLVIVGQRNDYWRNEVDPIIKGNKLDDKIVVLENVSEEKLTVLYRDADLFVFPSLREGFGFPPVEASMMCTPVLSTKEDSLDEVSLGLWYTYNRPLDVEELAEKMRDVLLQPPTDQQLQYIREKMIDNYSPNVVCKRICDNLLSINVGV